MQKRIRYMSYKQIALGLSAFLLGFLLAEVYFPPFFSGEQINRATEDRELARKGTKIETRGEYESTDKVDMDIRYPFLGLPKIDEGIKNFVNEEKQKAQKIADEIGLFEERKHSLNINWDYFYENDNLVSIKFLVYNDTGGAHGNQLVIGKNYLKENGKEISLKDIFKANSDYLGRISKMTTEDLSLRLKNNFFKEGAEPKGENFQSFTFNDDSLIFHFSPYQVAAYALGDQESIVKKEDLREILK